VRLPTDYQLSLVHTGTVTITKHVAYSLCYARPRRVPNSVGTNHGGVTGILLSLGHVINVHMIINKSSTVAEMGDRLATVDIG